MTYYKQLYIFSVKNHLQCFHKAMKGFVYYTINRKSNCNTVYNCVLQETFFELHAD